MIALLTLDCSLSEKAHIIDAIERVGLRAHLDRLEGRERIGAPGAPAELARSLATFSGVADVLPQENAYALVARSGGELPENGVRVGPAVFGGTEIVVSAGPCAVETAAQIEETAQIVAAAGARLLRGGAFKPRTSPYSFQGLGEEGLELLARAGAATGLPVVTEVVSPAEVEVVAEHADMLQVGARNMQNFSLLRAVGERGRPVLLKRGMMSTIEELLMSAEYILSAGNQQVILCERGIRTFERATRNTLDISAVPVIKRNSHLPVIVDPSHAVGQTEFVTSMALAAVAAGADGVIVEIHPSPETAWCDGVQSLSFDLFDKMMEGIRSVAAAVGRPMEGERNAR